jgi:hypothetical protein
MQPGPCFPSESANPRNLRNLNSPIGLMAKPPHSKMIAFATLSERILLSSPGVSAYAVLALGNQRSEG